MRATLVLLIAMALAPYAGGTAVAQDLQPAPPHDLVWIQAVGAALDETVAGVVVDASGDILTAGHFSGTVTFGLPPDAITLTAHGGRDVFVTRQDVRGRLLWAKHVGGTGSTSIGTHRSLASGWDGSLYLTGFFSGTTDFDPGAGTSLLSALGNSDAFLMRLSSDGDLTWVHQFGAPGETAYPLAVAAGGIYVYMVGYCDGPIDFDPGPGSSIVGNPDFFMSFTVKLYDVGLFLWARGGDYEAANQAVAADGEGNVYVAGTGGRLTKFTSGGLYDWYHYFGGGILALAVDEAGDVYAGGFAPPSPYTGRVFKVDSDGNTLWSRVLGGPGESLVITLLLGDGDEMYIAGRFGGTANLSLSIAPEASLTSAGLTDAFVTRLTRSGQFSWTQRMGGTAPDETRAVALDATGRLYVTGIFRGTADFDGGPGTLNRTSAGGADGFVARYGTHGVLLEGTAPTLIHFDAAGVSPTFDVVTGLLSQLVADRTFGSADCLARFNGSPGIDPSTPPLGDGFYYLARAVTCCGMQEYGSSVLYPDPREDLALANPCP